LRPDAPPRHREFSGKSGLDAATSSTLSRVTALHAIARTGYGAATKGVLAMLGAGPDGYTARDMIDAIAEAGFEVQDPDIAVRSALNNLRKQGKVAYNEGTSKYELTAKGRASI
jgi:hypothetical protein